MFQICLLYDRQPWQRKLNVIMTKKTVSITWNVTNYFCFLLMRVFKYYYRCISYIKHLVSANLCNKINHGTSISYRTRQRRRMGKRRGERLTFELDFNSVTIFEVEVVGGLVVKNSVTVKKQSGICCIQWRKIEHQWSIRKGNDDSM